MTGRNCLWLELNFVTMYVLLAKMTWMAGYGGAVIWQNDCTCLTVSFDSVKSQSMKRWLALSRFWNEIDWQFSDPRIVTAGRYCKGCDSDPYLTSDFKSMGTPCPDTIRCDWQNQVNHPNKTGASTNGRCPTWKIYTWKSLDLWQCSA